MSTIINDTMQLTAVKLCNRIYQTIQETGNQLSRPSFADNEIGRPSQRLKHAVLRRSRPFFAEDKTLWIKWLLVNHMIKVWNDPKVFLAGSVYHKLYQCKLWILLNFLNSYLHTFRPVQCDDPDRNEHKRFFHDQRVCKIPPCKQSNHLWRTPREAL